jgi:hypothetical protein
MKSEQKPKLAIKPPKPYFPLPERLIAPDE